MLRKLILIATVIAILAVGCGKQEKQTAPLGSPENPIKMAFVPSLDTRKLVISGEKLAELLKKQTGLTFKTTVPTSYAAVISAMGAGKVDVGWLSPLPYVIAHDQYGVRVILRTVRNKSDKYWSFIIARTDTGINKLEDLKGKRFAYGDPVSTAGCLYAKDLIRSKGYDPDKFFSQVIYAGSHDKVVMAVYNKQVDGGAIYGGVASDAREKVVDTIKDVMTKTKVIAKSVDIPNDTVSVRKDLPEELVKKIADGLIKVASSDEGRIAVMSLYGIDGFVPAKDSDYDSVRKVAKTERIKIEQIK
ncbi:MAG: phosphate/phosphite/phosphonate ABC transporter substrate-binding protein [Armatimonadetes bacterium]|nr:phosphate/phosphite/phosphonate ABC transporter substrate-binding protein [Armatimonadota bacterium]